MGARRWRQIAWLVCLMAACAPVASARAGVVATPVASPAAGVEGLLARAAATMTAVSSYRFVLSYEEGKTTIYDRIEMERAEGVVVRPDRFQATITAKLGIVSVDVEVISVEQRIWVEFAGIDEEISIDPDVARVLLDPTSILIGALTAIENPAIVEETTADGVALTRIAGTVDPTRLEAGAENPVIKAGGAMPVEITLAADGTVVSLRLDGPLIGADSDDVARRLDLSAFNEPATIEAPD